MRQTAENLVFFELIGHRHLNGAVEGEVAVVHAAQRLHRGLHDEVAFQHPAAEPGAGKLDLLGQRYFFLAAQKGDFTHLRQIHPHRVVGPRLPVFPLGEQFVGHGVQLGIVVFINVVDQQRIEIFFVVQYIDRLFG